MQRFPGVHSETLRADRTEPARTRPKPPGREHQAPTLFPLLLSIRHIASSKCAAILLRMLSPCSDSAHVTPLVPGSANQHEPTQRTLTHHTQNHDPSRMLE